MRGITVLLTLFLGFQLAGCISEYEIGNPVEVRVSEHLGHELQSQWEDKISQAAMIWEKALGETCVVPFPMRGEGSPLVITLYSKEEWGMPGTLGYAPTSDVIDVQGPSPGEPMGFMIDILVHEMGHILGLRHSEDVTSVMKSGTKVISPNTRDIEKARKLLGCS